MFEPADMVTHRGSVALTLADSVIYCYIGLLTYFSRYVVMYYLFNT